MEFIADHELRGHTNLHLDRAERGETFTITRNGEPVARLGPVHPTGLHLTSQAERVTALEAWAYRAEKTLERQAEEIRALKAATE